MTRAEKRRNAKAEAKRERYKRTGFSAREARISITPTPTKGKHLSEDVRLNEMHIRAVQKMDWRKAIQKLGHPAINRAPHAHRGTQKRPHAPRRHSNIIKGVRP